MTTPKQPRRRPVSRLVVLAAGAALALTFAGLAASSNGANDPIKVLVLSPVVSSQNNYPEIPFVGKIYADWLNKTKGGIGGHPLKVIGCDTHNDQNAAAACARKAVSEKVVAVVGSYHPTTDPIIPVLQAGSIPYVGACCPAGTDEFRSTISFPVGSVLLTGGAAAIAGQVCKRPALVVLQSAANGFLKDVMGRALKGQGSTDYKEVDISATPTDYSPKVAEATSGTDCVIGVMAENHWFAWLPSQQQSGAKTRLIGFQGNLNPHVADKFPAATQNAIDVGVYPVLSDPTLKTFRQVWAAAKPPKSYDESGLGAVGTWAAFVQFTNVVTKAKITSWDNLNVLAAYTKAKAATAEGIIPTIDYTKPLKVAGFPRTFNRYVTVAVIKNSKFLPFGTKKFVDVLPAWYGRKISF